jgi:hypothetical protein
MLPDEGYLKIPLPLQVGLGPLDRSQAVRLLLWPKLSQLFDSCSASGSLLPSKDFWLEKEAGNFEPAGTLIDRKGEESKPMVIKTCL